MTDEEREQKLLDLCRKLANNFTKEGKASGLPAEDGILALINFATDAIVQVAGTSDDPPDFVGWSVSTFFDALRHYSEQHKIELGFVMQEVDAPPEEVANDDDDDDDDSLLH